MLDKLRRRKVKKVVWIILAVLILPAFLLWGSSSLIRNKQDPAYAGKISGRSISFLEFKEAVDATRNQIIMQFGDNYAEVQKSLNLENLAWDRLIMLEEAKKERIMATDKEVIEAIKSYAIFSGGGGFDNRIYSQMLQYVFHTPARAFEEQTRQDLILARFYQKVTADIKLSDKETEEQYRKLNEKISVYYIGSLPSDFAKEIMPADEELKDYFAKNQLRFKQPPSFNIEYISWTEEDEDLQEIKNKAEGLLLKKNNFSQNAKKAGFKVTESGFFAQSEPIPGIGWSPEILALLSGAKAGELLPVIHSGKYYYIISLKEKKEAYIPNFQGAKEKVKEAFLKEKSGEAALTKLKECLKELKTPPESADLKMAAEKFNLKYGSTDLFVYGSYIENIGISDAFWDKANALKNNSYSDIIELPSGLYIIKLKERVTVSQEKFAAEKEEFGRKLLTEKKDEYFSTFFEGLKTKVRRF